MQKVNAPPGNPERGQWSTGCGRIKERGVSSTIPIPHSFYISQSSITDPGEYGHYFDDIPNDVPMMCEVVQGLLIHVLQGKRYGYNIPAERKSQVELFSVEDILRQLVEYDTGPLIYPRPFEKRVVCTCRHVALMLCSIMRHHGIPARIRNGFSTYLNRGILSDHWICEYWHAEWERWVMVDAQMDAVHRAVLSIDFYALDVPPIRQLPAGEVWRSCRHGDLDPQQCGTLDIRGWNYVKANLIRDFLALNKHEMLPWDGSSLSDVDYNAMAVSELYLMDHIAEITDPVIDDELLQQTYEFYPALHPKSRPNPHQHS